MAGDQFDQPFLLSGSGVLYMISSCLISLRTLHIVTHLADTMHSLRVYDRAFGYGAYVMAVNLLSKAVVDSNPSKQLWYLGAAGIWGAAFLNTCLTVCFFQLCYQDKKLPEPLWNAPTVSIAMIGWTGVSVNMNRAVVEASFWAGMAICVLCLPPQIWRVLAHPKAVAPDASCAMMMAPGPFMTAVWYSIGGVSRAPAHTVHFLQALSSATFACTLLALCQRCGACAAQPFGQSWVAFTFPLVSTTTGALLVVSLFFYYTSNAKFKILV